MVIQRAIRLPRTYDVGVLQSELGVIVDRFKSAPQPGPYHNGDWTGISLYSQGGKEGAFPSAAGLEPYTKTAALEHAPYMTRLLEELECPKEVVRLLSLPAGAVIQEHFDLHTNFQYGLLRLHIPIVTHPNVEFVIDGMRCDWREGELWFGDFSLPHSVRNNSNVNRVHMVIDVQINDFLLSLFPPEYVAERRREGISLCRERLPANAASLRPFVCDFDVPADVMPILVIGRPLRELIKGARGSTRIVDGKLVAHLDGAPAFGLERVTETSFAITGLGNGCSLDFRMDGPNLEGVELALRGLPKDLFAARLGKWRKDAVIAERRIELPLRPS